MQLPVEVGTTVLYHEQTVVRVGGMEQCRQDDPAGGDAEQDECVDLFRAQDQFQVGSDEGADPVLGDDDVVANGATAGWIAPAAPWNSR